MNGVNKNVSTVCFLPNFKLRPQILRYLIPTTGLGVLIHSMKREKRC